jgi:hypothetical protein
MCGAQRRVHCANFELCGLNLNLVLNDLYYEP